MMEGIDGMMKEGKNNQNKLSDCDGITEIDSKKEDMEESEQNCKSHNNGVKPMDCDKISLETGEMEDDIQPEDSSKLKSPGQWGESRDNVPSDNDVTADNNQSDPKNSPNGNNHEGSNNVSDRAEKPEGSSDISGVMERCQPCCSTSRFHKLKSKVKKRHYRKKSSGAKDIKWKDKNPSENNEAPNPRLTAEHEMTRSCSEEQSEERIQFSSDENSDNEGWDSSDWTTASEDELNEGPPRVLRKNPPKPRMFIVPEVINRQIGITRQFERKFYGSLHVVQRLELMQKMEEHECCVNGLNFNREGNLLASTSDDLRVVIWDWAIGRKRHVFETGHKSNVFEVKWLPLDFENYVATCGLDGKVRLLDICTGTHRKLASHHGPARRLGIHADHPHTVLSVGDDAKILCIDIRGGKPTTMLTVKERPSDMHLYSIHINPRNSHQFCISGGFPAVKIYDRRKLSIPLQRFCPEDLTNNTCTHVTCAMYNYNGTEIIASYNDDDIYLFDAVVLHPSGDCAHRYEGHRNNATVKSVNFFGPKSEFIVSGSDCGNIFFWDKNTEAIVQWFPGDEQGVVNGLESHPHVPILATSGLDHEVKIWIPSCEQAPQMNKLEDCVKSNLRNRAADMARVPDDFDEQMITLFLPHMRDYAGFTVSHILQVLGLLPTRIRHIMRPFDDNSDSSSEAGSVHRDTPSEEANEGPQCATS